MQLHVLQDFKHGQATPCTQVHDNPHDLCGFEGTPGVQSWLLLPKDFSQYLTPQSRKILTAPWQISPDHFVSASATSGLTFTFTNSNPLPRNRTLKPLLHRPLPHNMDLKRRMRLLIRALNTITRDHTLHLRQTRLTTAATRGSIHVRRRLHAGATGRVGGADDADVFAGFVDGDEDCGYFLGFGGCVDGGCGAGGCGDGGEGV